MSEFILIIIMLGTIVFVSQPYWRRQAIVKPDSTNGQITDLIEKRDNLLAQIKEIEFDQETGKVSAEDFAEMNARLRFETVTVLKRIDALIGKKRTANRLEEELENMRTARKTDGFKSCGRCGKLVSVKGHFCAYCGYELIS